MADLIGTVALPIPIPGQEPDGPGAFFDLATRLALLLDPLPNVAALPASDNWAGRRATVVTVPGAFFEWTGVTWTMMGTAVFPTSAARDAALPSPQAGWKAYTADTFLTATYAGSVWVPIIDTVSADLIPATGIGAVATATIITTLVLPAVPMPSKTLLTFEAKAGFAGADAIVALAVSTSAGTLTQSTNRQVRALSAQWATVVQSCKLLLAANTAATITIRTNSSINAYYDLGGSWQRFVGS